jgi:single-stranded-DNA-specific exonuclease
MTIAIRRREVVYGGLVTIAAEAPEKEAIARPTVRPRGCWSRATGVLHAFLAQVPARKRQVVLCHSDADGLAAGVILTRGLERSGRSDVRPLATGKGQSAWSLDILEQIATMHPAALYVVDLGSRPRPIFPAVPTLLVDHHRSQGVPPSALLISSYRWRPSPCTAALTWWLMATLTDVSDLDWIAALGIIGDMGEHAEIEPLPTARRRYGARILRSAASLVHAARRSASGDPGPALDALLEAREPGDIVHGRLSAARELAELRRAFNAALAATQRVSPVFRDRVALIRVNSPYQVHPCLAQVWRGRLPDHVVIVANDGYVPDAVAFSITTDLDISLLEFMAAFRSSLDPTEFGYGHDKATGGSLSPDEWKRFMATLGFR